MVTLTVGTLNVHNHLGAARALLREEPDTAGLGEAQRLVKTLARLKRYQVVVEPTRQGGGTRGTSQEVPILTRKRFPTLGRLTLQISEDVKATWRVSPERWLTVHLFSHPIGPVAHFNLHPNAAVMGHGLEVPRVQEYAESMASLNRALMWARREGFTRVLTADINFRDVKVDPAWSPYRVLDRRGMEVHHAGPIDVVAADQDLKLAKPLKVLPAKATGTDHPGAVATFTR